MLKLLTGCGDASLISATIELESMPPERNAPSGTSAIIWRTRPAAALAQRLGRLAVAPRSQRHGGRVPVAMHRRLSVAIAQEMCRRQLVHALQHGPRRQHVFVGEELIERDRIELARDFRPDQQRLHFGRQPQALARSGPVERLLAGAVAGGDQRPRAAVPQREREHPAQAAREIFAPLLVSMDQDFDVGVRERNRWPCCFELALQSRKL